MSISTDITTTKMDEASSDIVKPNLLTQKKDESKKFVDIDIETEKNKDTLSTESPKYSHTNAGMIRVKLSSASLEWNNRAEVEIPCENIDEVLKNMLNNIVDKFSVDSVVSIEKSLDYQTKNELLTEKIEETKGKVISSDCGHTHFNKFEDNQSKKNIIYSNNYKSRILHPSKAYTYPRNFNIHTPLQENAYNPYKYQYKLPYTYIIPSKENDQKNFSISYPIHESNNYVIPTYNSKEISKDTNELLKKNTCSNDAKNESLNSSFNYWKPFLCCKKGLTSYRSGYEQAQRKTTLPYQSNHETYRCFFTQPQTTRYASNNSISKISALQNANFCKTSSRQISKKCCQSDRVPIRYEPTLLNNYKNEQTKAKIPFYEKCSKCFPRVVETKIIEKIVEMPSKVTVQVPTPYPVDTPTIIANYEDKNIPVVLSQKIFEEYQETNDVVEVEMTKYVPYIVPVDVYIPKPINVPIKPKDPYQEKEKIENISCQQLQQLMLEMNPHLAHLDQFNASQNEKFQTSVNLAREQAKQYGLEPLQPITSPLVTISEQKNEVI